LTVNYFVSILVVVWLAAEFLSVCESILFPCFTIDVWSADLQLHSLIAMLFMQLTLIVLLTLLWCFIYFLLLV